MGAHPIRQVAMSEQEGTTHPGIDQLDPRKMQAATESGELERPRLRQKIECHGNPEIADRRHLARGANSATRDHQ